MQEGEKRMLMTKLHQSKNRRRNSLKKKKNKTENQNNSGKQGKDFCTSRKK